MSRHGPMVSVRTSNTEPLLRLNLEAKTPAFMEEKKAAVSKIIKGRKRFGKSPV